MLDVRYSTKFKKDFKTPVSVSLRFTETGVFLFMT